MIEVGEYPILWHIMKHYSYYGFNEFVICLGYKGYMIKEYFRNYFLHQSDVTINLSKNSLVAHNTKVEPWEITLVDTGLQCGTGGRLKRIKEYIGNEPFMMTYGDGVSNVNLQKLLEFHKKSKRLATITAAQPTGRFGVMKIGSRSRVESFDEKPKGDSAWVNSGYFVLEPGIFKFIESESSMWEQKPLKTIAEKKQLTGYKHSGFWYPMDTLRDKVYLDELWAEGKAPWKIWR